MPTSQHDYNGITQRQVCLVGQPARCDIARVGDETDRDQVGRADPEHGAPIRLQNSSTKLFEASFRNLVAASL